MSAATHPVRRLKYAVEGCFNGVWGDEANGVDDMAVVRVADFNRERSRVELGEDPTVRAIPQNARNRRILAPGDLLIEKSGGGELQPVGNVVSFDDERPSVCSNFVARMPVASDCEPRFVAYVFRSLYEQGKNIPHIKQTSGIQNLDSESYLNEVAWLPERETQLRIANFLDDKTTRIDALIAEKELLLTLLAEQRLSVSEQVLACTSVAARTKLSFEVDLLPGFAFSSDSYSSDEADIPLLRGVNVTPSAVRWDDTVYWPRELYTDTLARFKLETGDVVFGMDRPWISSGARTAIVDTASAGALLLQRVCRLRGRGRMSQRFIFYALCSDQFRQSIEVDLTGVSVPHISPDQILKFKVPALSLAEQEARCSWADKQLDGISKLEAQATSMLDALKEYRSSLISAAVTGQLDFGSFEASRA